MLKLDQTVTIPVHIIVKPVYERADIGAYANDHDCAQTSRLAYSL